MPHLFGGLPVELVAQIFFIVAQESHASKGYRNLMRANLLLSSVCSQWRRIALATPSLWSYIHLSATRLREPYGKVDAAALSRIRAYLERSGSISIDLRYDFWDSREQQEAIWPIVTPHLHRARSIGMGGLTSETVDLIFPLSGTLERLRDLSLHYLGDPFAIPYAFRNDRTPPNLNSITLYDITFQNMPITPLTRLSLYYRLERSWSDVLLSLAPHPHLQHVTLDFDLVHDDVSRQPLNLPNLTSLYLRGSSFDQYLLTPVLEHLQYCGSESRIDLEKLRPLKRLTFDRSSERILNDWGSSPSLVSLRTLDLVRCDHILPMLACLSHCEVNSTPSIFPCLHMLRLKNCVVPNHAFEENTLTAIFDVLDARPDLVIESDADSVYFSPFNPLEWSELQTRSGGRLSRLAEDSFTGLGH